MAERPSKRQKPMPGLLKALAEHPRPAGAKHVGYGTAGFRGKFDEAMEHIFLRIGIMAYLRAAKLGSVTGVMVTASHNAEPDNGAKICESGGDMMAQAWEPHAAALANLTPAEAVVSWIHELAATEDLDLSVAAEVYVAKDTRPSSPAAAALVIKGVEACGGTGERQRTLAAPLTAIGASAATRHVVRAHSTGVPRLMPRAARCSAGLWRFHHPAAALRCARAERPGQVPARRLDR